MSAFKQDSKEVLEAVAQLEKKLGIQLEPFSKDINIHQDQIENKEENKVVEQPKLDRLPNPKFGEEIKCSLCATKPLGPVTFCDCCNHPFCCDCKIKVDEIRDNPFVKKDFAGDVIGHKRTGTFLVGDMQFFCFCNATKNLHLAIRDKYGKSIHFTQPEHEKIYMFKKARAVKLEKLFREELVKHPSTTLDEFLSHL